MIHLIIPLHWSGKLLMFGNLHRMHIGIKCFIGQVLDLTKDVGHWQGKSRVVGGRTENYLQRISSEVKKTDHQVGWVGRESLLQILNIVQVEEEDKKLLEEVDREAIDSNLTTMMMINEW